MNSSLTTVRQLHENFALQMSRRITLDSAILMIRTSLALIAVRRFLEVVVQ